MMKPLTAPALLQILRHYFEVKGFSADWKQLESCGDERLVTSLAMICPFEVAEKQALLESGRAGRAGPAADHHSANGDA